MDRPVLYRELVELKDWMITSFVTKQEYSDFKHEMLVFREEMLEFKDQTLSRFDSLFAAFEDLKQEQVFTNQALKRIESKLGI